MGIFTVQIGYFKVLEKILDWYLHPIISHFDEILSLLQIQCAHLTEKYTES